MKYLGEGMNQLPSNLLNLELYLDKNNLGQKPVNIKWLEKNIKLLPINLNLIELDL